MYVYPSSDSGDSFGVGHARDVASDDLSYPRSNQGHPRDQKHNPCNRASFGSCCAVNGRLESHVAWHRNSNSLSGPVWPEHVGGSWIGKARVRLRTLLHDAPLSTQDTLGNGQALHYPPTR